ncbi:MAG TPA: heavy-metal-associated domain-containing protein [Melioribacteraceae bacterium]|nr:heavy-metal-associated domain-containing protein [Melioribacteraceae bacterium]
MNQKKYIIENMSCQHCVMAVKKELAKLELESCDVEIGSAEVKFDETKVTEEEIISSIEEAGYSVRKN